MGNFRTFIVIAIVVVSAGCKTTKTAMQPYMSEKHRPQFHFSPRAHWMNDPNGLVYLNGTYHLFFQYNPGGTTWGPMHWGHTTSKDLLHWTEQPIALYPDSLGAIFSGSAVIDKHNTAGFGNNAMVAIFTYHNQKKEEAKTGLHQYQGLAYSTDEGKTWTKYKGNPVLPNPGIWDFRDPKVQWFEAEKKWLMTLATKDRITFYSSPDLKKWTKESDFGATIGAHGGVWECPDLFSLNYNGQEKWVLLVSINPGGPSGGSATQYFTGSFDGKTFVPDDTTTRWMDYGADNYAGVTYSNTGARKILIGWMSNWQYANVVPTQNWRSATTIPRELKLLDINGKAFLASEPVTELEKIIGPVTSMNQVEVNGDLDLSTQLKSADGKYLLDMELDSLQDIELHLSNSKGNEVVVGYDETNDTYYVDRTKSGEINFEQTFARKTFAPRITGGKHLSMKLLVDVASAEVFADGGLSVLTNIFFPDEPLNSLHITAKKPLKIKRISYSAIKPVAGG